MRHSYGTSPVPHFILRGRDGGNTILLPDTDQKDAEWIAELLQHGLLRASFVPPRPQRELREVTSYRSKLVEERARLVNRIQKVLEDSNVKLASVATDITGVSGRAILGALLDGQEDPQALAELARGRMRTRRDELAQAVQGTLGEHHRFMLKSQLRQLDFYDTQIGELDQEIARRLEARPTRTPTILIPQTANRPPASESRQLSPCRRTPGSPRTRPRSHPPTGCSARPRRCASWTR